MKKRIKQTILFVIITMMILSVCKPVKAAGSYNIEIISSAETVQIGQEIEVTIKIKDITGVDTTYGGVAGLSAKLEYDTAKLEKIKVEGLNGFMFVEGDTIELAKYPGVTEDTEMMKFKFKSKAEGEATIKLKEVSAANGDETIPLGKEVTKTIKIGEEGPNTTLSNNNNLKSLKVDGVEVSNFDKGTLTYTLKEVENSKASIKIEAEAEDAKATVEGVGTKDLKVGANSFDVVVKAEDGTTKTYTIKVERKDKEENKPQENKPQENKPQGDNSQSQDKIPNAGAGSYIMISAVGIIGIIGIFAVISYIKMKKLSGI